MRVQSGRIHLARGFIRYRDLPDRVDAEAAQALPEMAPGIEIPVSPVKHQPLGGHFSVRVFIARPRVVADRDPPSSQRGFADRPKETRLNGPGCHMQNADPPADLAGPPGRAGASAVGAGAR